MRSYSGWGGLDPLPRRRNPFGQHQRTTILFQLFDIENVLLFLQGKCPLEAKHCHKCEDRLNPGLKQNVTEDAGSVNEGTKKDDGGGGASTTGSGSGALTSAQV